MYYQKNCILNREVVINRGLKIGENLYNKFSKQNCNIKRGNINCKHIFVYL